MIPINQWFSEYAYWVYADREEPRFDPHFGPELPVVLLGPVSTWMEQKPFCQWSLFL